MIFFDPVIVLLFFLLVIGVAFGIISKLTEILFVLGAVIFLFIGFYVMVKGVREAIELKHWWWGIAEVLRGLFVSTISIYIFIFLAIGCGHVSVKSLERVRFVLFGTVDKLDIFMVVFLLSIFSIAITIVPVTKAKNTSNIKSKFVLQMISLLFIFLIYSGIFVIGIKSEYINSKETFSWSSPEYETLRETSVKHIFTLFTLTTGKLKKGTKLYANGYKLKFDATDYFEVTDGNIIGYVSSEDLKPLVE